jgi:hypothetical protein
MLQEVASRGAEVMIASHNQASVELTVKIMAAHGIRPQVGLPGPDRCILGACAGPSVAHDSAGGQPHPPPPQRTHNKTCITACLLQGGGVYFGQLLGMADHLSFGLGQNGYQAYK